MTKYSDEERATIVAEARDSLRRLADFKPRERSIGDPIDPLAKWRAEAEAQQQQAPAMVYKTHEAAPAVPPAPDTTDERIADERQFIFAVIAQALGELDARHQAEIESLKTSRRSKSAFFNTPRDMVEGARELRAQTDKVLAAVAALHAASERDQQQRRSDPLDLPALPRRDFN